MKAEQFPINYFSGIASPRKIFLGRKNFSWFQLIFIYIFLNALLLIPVTLNLATSYQFSLADSLPEVAALLDDQTAAAFSELPIENGELETSESTILNQSADGIVGVNLTEAELAGQTTVVNFTPTTWQITGLQGEREYSFELYYTDSLNPSQATSGAALQKLLGQQFFANQRLPIIISALLATGFLLFVMNLFLVLGSAFFLWLTKKSSFSSIGSFKESLSIIIQCLGLGTILAFVFGLIYYDVTMMIAVQMLTMIILLFAIYIRTKFKDQKVSGENV
ncbi:hypothetical protein ACYSNU_14700 [Enterococcus sp. LJL120]